MSLANLPIYGYGCAAGRRVSGVLGSRLPGRFPPGKLPGRAGYHGQKPPLFGFILIFISPLKNAVRTFNQPNKNHTAFVRNYYVSFAPNLVQKLQYRHQRIPGACSLAGRQASYPGENGWTDGREIGPALCTWDQTTLSHHL